jgi:hypothetical protein
LACLVSSVHTRLEDHKDKVDTTLADMEFATSLLATKVGDCPVALGTDNIFQILEEVVKDVAVVQQDVAVMQKELL